MTDLVERQAVIDAIHLFFTEEVYKIPTEKIDDGNVLTMGKLKPFLTMNKTLSRRIKALPSVPTVSDLIKDIKEWINTADEMGYQVTYDDLFQFLDKWGDADD